MVYAKAMVYQPGSLCPRKSILAPGGVGARYTFQQACHLTPPGFTVMNRTPMERGETELEQFIPVVKE